MDNLNGCGSKRFIRTVSAMHFLDQETYLKGRLCRSGAGKAFGQRANCFSKPTAPRRLTFFRSPGVSFEEVILPGHFIFLKWPESVLCRSADFPVRSNRS